MCEAEKYQVRNGFLVRNYYRGGLRFGFTTCLANYRNLNFSSKFWIICFHQYQKKKLVSGYWQILQLPETAQEVGPLILGRGDAINISWALDVCVEGVGNKMSGEQDCN